MSVKSSFVATALSASAFLAVKSALRHRKPVRVEAADSGWSVVSNGEGSVRDGAPSLPLRTNHWLFNDSGRSLADVRVIGNGHQSEHRYGDVSPFEDLKLEPFFGNSVTLGYRLNSFGREHIVEVPAI